MLHVALRAPRDAAIQSDGKNVVPDVWEVLDKIQKFSNTIRSGSWVCSTISFTFFDIVCLNSGVTTVAVRLEPLESH